MWSVLYPEKINVFPVPIYKQFEQNQRQFIICQCSMCDRSREIWIGISPRDFVNLQTNDSWNELLQIRLLNGNQKSADFVMCHFWHRILVFLERFWTHTAQFIIDWVYPNIFRPHTKYFPWRRKPSSNWLSHSCHAAVSRSHTRHTSLKPNLSVQSGINYLTIPR